MSGLTPEEGLIFVRFALGRLCLFKFVVDDCAMFRVGGDGGCCVVA